MFRHTALHAQLDALPKVFEKVKVMCFYLSEPFPVTNNGPELRPTPSY